MKKTKKSTKLIKSKMVFMFKKNVSTTPCSGGTVDTTTITTTTGF
ncbi:hypothetical protein [Daejeonella sp. H1SJ63]|jgi:hypothetical protein|nr:hypothetical protein [Daejeonella sp. H1SJ63]